MFRVIFISVSVLLFTYIGLQLTQHGQLSEWAQSSIWAWLALVFGFMMLMPLYLWRFRGQRTPKKIVHLMALGHGVMAYLNFLIPVVLIRDIVGLLAVILKLNLDLLYSAEASVIILFLPIAFKLWGRRAITRGPVVIKEEIKDERLPPEFKNLRILQISDLHISHFLKKGFIEKVLVQVEKVKPDLIFLTGDIVDGPIEDLQDEVAKLKSLKANYGVYYVPGNHEYYWDYKKIEKAIEAAGITSIPNTSRMLKRGSSQILIAGVTDPAAVHYGSQGPMIERFQSEFTTNQYRILLAHQPFMADKASQVGFHLQLSGHTHAGQFFPWNLLIGFFQKYAKGFYQVESLNLYVNQGTGYWGPAIRIGTQCEITEISFN